MGAELMKDSDVARVRNIGSRHIWRNVDGVPSEFLSANETDNLCIRKGTLTAAERDVINYHFVAPIKMLERLPWPKHPKNVTEYAGGHHERMGGKGYPKGLVRDQMSVPARILGVADIFEALTASDLPYKASMVLSQAMNTMNELKRNGHIDPDVFDIFVNHSVYRRYGEQYLEPEQLDDVHLTL